MGLLLLCGVKGKRSDLARLIALHLLQQSSLLCLAGNIDFDSAHDSCSVMVGLHLLNLNIGRVFILAIMLVWLSRMQSRLLLQDLA